MSTSHRTYRTNADGSAVCPHRDLSVCAECVAADPDLIDCVGVHFHVPGFGRILADFRTMVEDFGGGYHPDTSDYVSMPDGYTQASVDALTDAVAATGLDPAGVALDVMHEMEAAWEARTEASNR